MFCAHSCKSPIKSMNTNSHIIISWFVVIIIDLKFIGIGNIKAISMSKIRKIIASIKNREENGNRADDLGSKPHSKGVSLFLRRGFFSINNVTKIRSEGISIVINTFINFNILN